VSESPVVKAAMELLGRPGGGTRLPSRALRDDERQELHSLLVTLGVGVGNGSNTTTIAERAERKTRDDEKVEGPFLRMLIDGEAVSGAGGATFPVIDPSTGRAFAEAPQASRAQAESAVEAAKGALPKWSALSLSDRRAYLKRAAELLDDRSTQQNLARLLVREQGKTLDQAVEEVTGCIDLIRDAIAMPAPQVDVYADDAKKRVETRRVPVGVVAGITPWNFPLFCGVQKWAPALVLGNTFVWKPSPHTPLASLALGRIVSAAFPRGVLSILTGADGVAFNLGAFLTSHPLIDKVSFTGSVATGKRILRASACDVKRVTLECGGNDAAIVRSDCDVSSVASEIFARAFEHTGQVCCAIKRVFVHGDIAKDFVSALVRCARKAKLGGGLDKATTMGPLCNKMQHERVKDLVDDARKSGGTIECGGRARDGPGFFYEPTIVTGLKEGSRLVDEEQFGPALPVMTFTSDDEAVRRANATAFGLGASVWSKDVKRANEMASRLRAGTCWVNDHLTLTGAPFGGFKTSGLGRELGKSDVEAFTELQTFQLAK